MAVTGAWAIWFLGLALCPLVWKLSRTLPSVGRLIARAAALSVGVGVALIPLDQTLYVAPAIQVFIKQVSTLSDIGLSEMSAMQIALLVSWPLNFACACLSLSLWRARSTVGPVASVEPVEPVSGNPRPALPQRPS